MIKTSTEDHGRFDIQKDIQSGPIDLPNNQQSIGRFLRGRSQK